MKVAPAEKKAKPLPSQLLKPKAFKVGAAVTKKKKETVMKGLSKMPLSSDTSEPRTVKSRKSMPAKSASSPGPKETSQEDHPSFFNELQRLMEGLTAPKRKSLPATLPMINKGTPKEDLNGKAMKLNKRKSLIGSTVSGEQQDDAAELVTPSKRLQKSQLNLLKRKSLVSSPRNSFMVKPLENATPSKTQKNLAVSTPSEQVKSPKKSTAVSTPGEVKSSPVSSPSPKSTNKPTPSVESAKVKKLLLKRKSLNATSVEETALTPASETKKTLSKRKSLAVATPSILTPVSKAKVAKQSSVEETAPGTPHQKATKVAGQVATPIQSESKNLKRKASTISTPAVKTDQLSPAKVQKVLQKEQTGQKNKSPKKGKGTVRDNKESSELAEKATETPPKEKKIRALVKKGLKTAVVKQDLTKDSRIRDNKGSSEPVEKATETPPKEKKIRALVKKGLKISAVKQDLTEDARLKNLVEAAEAVLQVVDDKQAALSKKHLFSSDAQPISLQIHGVRVPQTPPRILRFNLPHSVHEDNANICLILGDPVKGRKRDTEQEVIVEDYKEMLQNKGVKNIKEVIPFNYLRAQYGPYEMKRRFAQTFDVVLCDSRFLGHAQHFLGQDYFTRKTLMPVRVFNEKKKDWVDDFKSAIDFALHKTWMRIHPKGATFNVTVGHTQFTKEQIAANLLAVFNELQSVFPGGLDNIKMAALKCHEALPVPVFASLKSHDEVAVPVARAPHNPLGEPATDEISTLPGREVTVYPGGRIEVHNKMTKEDEDYEKSMGHESKWKRQQRKLAKRQKNATDEEEVPSPKKTKGQKRLQGKKFSPGKKLPGKKSSPGKKFSGVKTTPGKKFAGKKQNLVKKGKSLRRS